MLICDIDPNTKAHLKNGTLRSTQTVQDLLDTHLDTVALEDDVLGKDHCDKILYYYRYGMEFELSEEAGG